MGAARLSTYLVTKGNCSIPSNANGRLAVIVEPQVRLRFELAKSLTALDDASAVRPPDAPSA